MQQQANHDQEQEFQEPCQQCKWSRQLQGSPYTHTPWDRLLLEGALGDVFTITAEPANPQTVPCQQQYGIGTILWWRQNKKLSWPLSCNNQQITSKNKSFKEPCQQRKWSLELQGSLYTHTPWERLLLEGALGDVFTITAVPANPRLTLANSSTALEQ